MPILETERLLLRRFDKVDAADVFEYARSDSVGPNAGWKPHADIGETEKILIDKLMQDDVWAIEHKSAHKVIGSIGLHADASRSGVDSRMLGFVLSEKYWGRGYMTEAAKCLLKHAFLTLDLAVVSVTHFPHNFRSCRVIEKCGFKYEGIRRKALTDFNGKVHDLVVYSLLKEEFVLDFC